MTPCSCKTVYDYCVLIVWRSIKQEQLEYQNKFRTAWKWLFQNIIFLNSWASRKWKNESFYKFTLAKQSFSIASKYLHLDKFNFIS